jgi:hypothetical protein
VTEFTIQVFGASRSGFGRAALHGGGCRAGDGGVRVDHADALIRYADWPAPTVIGSDGPYGNLNEVAEALRSAATFTTATDERLDRALHYFERALFLFARRRTLASPLSRHHRTLISAIYLNLWKAVTTIVGDPSRDPDYQRRYRRFGMDHDFWQDRIERLRSLRNVYDVAHSELTEASSAEIEAAYWEGVSKAAEVIRRYREHLAQAANVQV